MDTQENIQIDRDTENISGMIPRRLKKAIRGLADAEYNASGQLGGGNITLALVKALEASPVLEPFLRK